MKWVKILIAGGSLLLIATPAFAKQYSYPYMRMFNYHSKMMKNLHHRSCGQMMSSKTPSYQIMHMNMNDLSSTRGLKIDKKAKLKRGEPVILQANHVPGMQGAKATIVNAYATKLYAVNYQPTTGGKMVKNHKWIIGTEFKSYHHLKLGSKVILTANHMPGMQGAKAKIVGIHKGPAYMINYRSTTNGHLIRNHRWLAQSEIKSIK